jgi:hypothetical protein
MAPEPKNESAQKQHSKYPDTHFENSAERPRIEEPNPHRKPPTLLYPRWRVAVATSRLTHGGENTG